jgi:hypothetical protein
MTYRIGPVLRPLCAAIALAGGLTASLWVSPAWAEDWWSVANGVDGQRVSSDADSLQCQNERCSVWERTVYGQPGADGVASLKDFAEYDCAKLTTRTQREVSFGTDGRQLQDLSSSSSGWQAVKSNAVGSSMMAFACSFTHYRNAAALKGVVDIYGQRFVRVSERRALPSERTSPSVRTIPSERAPAVLPALQASAARTAPLAAPRMQAAPSMPLPTSRSRTRIAAQIAATDTREGAQTIVDALKHRRQIGSANLLTYIKSKNVKGRRFYRVQVSGFESIQSARGFCREMRDRAPGCFVLTAGE